MSKRQLRHQHLIARANAGNYCCKQRKEEPGHGDCVDASHQPSQAHRADTILAKIPKLQKTGAGEGIRTLDPNLGKVVLYL